MLKRIKATDLKDETYQWIIETLRTKLQLFDYVTEEAFVRICKEGNYKVFLTEHMLVFCEINTHMTGLKTFSINVIKYSNEVECMEHMKEHLTQLEGIAKHLGMDRVILEGRIGWTKVFKDYDIEKVTLYKDV